MRPPQSCMPRSGKGSSNPGAYYPFRRWYLSVTTHSRVLKVWRCYIRGFPYETAFHVPATTVGAIVHITRMYKFSACRTAYMLPVWWRRNEATAPEEAADVMFMTSMLLWQPRSSALMDMFPSFEKSHLKQSSFFSCCMRDLDLAVSLGPKEAKIKMEREKNVLLWPAD